MWRVQRSRASRAAAVLGVVLLAVLPITPTAADDDGTGAWVAPTGKPNVLLIITDDQTVEQFTPSLMPQTFARVVDAGVAFDRAYVSTPLCCPSRSQILTGRTEANGGVDSTTGGRLVHPTVLDAAHDAGYRTLLSGKLLNNEPCADRPEIDDWLCTNEGRYTLVDPDLSLNGAPFARTSGWTGALLATHLAQEIASTAPTQPVFAVFAPPSPHQPAADGRYDGFDPQLGSTSAAFDEETRFSSAPAFRQRPPYTNGEAAQIEAARQQSARAVRALDDDIGTVLDALGPRADDTLVVFLSDNGFAFGEHRHVGKEAPYEEMVRVPMAMAWPGHVPVGLHLDSLVANLDVAPTLAGAMGVPWVSDGRDLVSVADGSSASLRPYVPLSYCHGAGRCERAPIQRRWQPVTSLDPVTRFSSMGWRGLVTPRWKYVEHDTGEVELFDLTADPAELVNLAGDPAVADVRASLMDTTAVAHSATVLDTAIHWAPTGEIDQRVVPVRYSARSRLSAVRCRLYPTGATPGAWAVCPPSSTVLGPLDDGAWTFDVAASDRPAGAGVATRRDTTPASVSFTVAAGAPPAVSASPARYVGAGGSTGLVLRDVTSSARCRVRGIGRDGRIDAGSWESCAPWSTGAFVGPVAEGTWVLEAQPLDDVGNPIGGAAVGLYTVDATGPLAVWEDRPSTSTGSPATHVNFRFDEHVVGVPTCSLDDVAVPCVRWSSDLVGLALGRHTFQVRAKDASGNARTTGFAFTYEVDGPPAPVLLMAGTIDANAKSPTLRVTWSGAPDRLQCSIDGGPWVVCADGADLDPWLHHSGPHDVRVRAIDRGSNASPEARQRIVRRGTAPDCGTRFSDVLASNTMCGSIAWLDDRRIASGYPDGTFGPSAKITRQALAAWAYRFGGQHDHAAPPAITDLGAADAFQHEIGVVVGRGLMDLDPDGAFRPAGTATRATLALLLHRRAGSPPPAADAPTFTDVQPGDPWSDAVRWAAGTGMIGGFPDGTFKPANGVTRQATALALHRDVS